MVSSRMYSCCFRDLPLYVFEAVYSSHSVIIIDIMDLFDSYAGPESPVLTAFLLLIK